MQIAELEGKLLKYGGQPLNLYISGVAVIVAVIAILGSVTSPTSWVSIFLLMVVAVFVLLSVYRPIRLQASMSENTEKSGAELSIYRQLLADMDSKRLDGSVRGCSPREE